MFDKSVIVDAHNHIWRKEDLPWLKGPMIPRIFGPYEPIRRDYLIEEYLADARPQGVAKSVYVQTNWGPSRGRTRSSGSKRSPPKAAAGRTPSWRTWTSSPRRAAINSPG